jgi:hypothetical protein
VLPKFAGKIEVGAVTWKPRLVIDFLRDAPTTIVVEGLRITDPEGTDVLRAPRLELKVRPRSALSGKVYLSDVKLGPGSLWRFARMGEREGIGFPALVPHPRRAWRTSPAASSQAGARRGRLSCSRSSTPIWTEPPRSSTSPAPGGWSCGT